ncbi:hypothetical protein lerEdw1_004906 [Lerista edwardsae]|nr:hypothetical protein lerEdw1_004906 [Lerista edwardsae]
MAAVGSRASFTVRRLLDLPEAEGGGGGGGGGLTEQDSPERYGVSPYRAWMETERSHYLFRFPATPGLKQITCTGFYGIPG